METKISKIQFRQDTSTNWTNSRAILSLGEPGLDVTTGQFKIGDGVTPFYLLPVQSFQGSPIGEVEANGKLYGRKRDAGASVGYWEELNIPKVDQRKQFSDLLATAYDTELDMNYVVKDHNGYDKKVYGIRHYQTISASIGEVVPTAVKNNVTKLIYAQGTISADGEHEYILPCRSVNFEANIYLDKETNSVMVQSKSVNERLAAPLDICILYTKD